MMPVRRLINRSRTRWSACKSSCSALLVATNFIVGRCTASANRLGITEVVLLPSRVGTHIFGRHQPSLVTKRSEFAAEMMCADTGLHADEARRQVGQPCFYLAAGPLLP